jgi:hypothetical protein
MANRFKRGSAPGRARSEDQRPGSFKKSHKKRGGRQRGTPNKFSAEYKKDITSRRCTASERIQTAS